LLRDALPKLAFLYTPDANLTVDGDALATLTADAPRVLRTAIGLLEALPDGVFDAATLEATLRTGLVEGLGLKARVAFAPVRTGISGAKVSPPLFESMELLGRESCLARLRALLGVVGPGE
jgi:glutamyl-tRNA synthetase